MKTILYFEYKPLSHIVETIFLFEFLDSFLELSPVLGLFEVRNVAKGIQDRFYDRVD